MFFMPCWNGWKQEKKGRKRKMYSEEIVIKLTKDHTIRCYRALVLTDKMIELYRKRMNLPLPVYPEDLEDIDKEFIEIIEKYVKGEEE